MLYKIENVHGVHAKIVAVGEHEETTYYVVQIHHGDRSYYVAKRYSEFHALWTTLYAAARAHAGRNNCTLCSHLPRFPKKLFFSTKASRQRRFEDLQAFLKATLLAIQGDLCDEAHLCSGAKAILSFLSIYDKSKQAPTMYDSVQLDTIHPDAWYRSRRNTEVRSNSTSHSSHRSSLDVHDLAFYATTPASTAAGPSL
ncbi:hypothetical protein SPRG_14766 [Saprolegnia parasitica CBS 223.65]|uniref:PX domain-containing protein n=1 Tax=Saprolegnia parasitica (strain CBS 223.65) TaxID=695850 RepID=A0A067BZH8_SAPPC|nr:hypothetical protein SPRG_14766 [Saprolegnia parasitica CBS 223.65]KDO19686.1 hypothetical protein SPRG_14766 [Saprolegnia parasitica CBS 223.65]|eukprot:XP_012209603.1 hypothetical protein SPRG_14766 [Saprolegnia parasitica CBS 223.65]